jgi:hypothetical protein
MDIAILGLDLGKNVCSVVGLDASGAIVTQRKVRRKTLIALAKKLAPRVVGMTPIPGIGAIVASALVAAVGQVGSRRGSVWSLDSSPPAASQSCLVSASAATNTWANN